MRKADLQAYIERINGYGFSIGPDTRIADVVAEIERSGFPRKSHEPLEIFINRFLRQRGQPEYKGEIVPSRSINKMRGEYKPKPHPRQADMRQPKLWTPNGIGNGAERHHGFSRGS